MSNNRDDFDFDDDFFQDNDDQFDFGGEEEELPAGLDEGIFEEDMPTIEEEPEERGGSRTFTCLAIIMILLFIGGLALVLYLILRPTGPSDLELTATQVVFLNQTVEAQLNMTQTAAREFDIMTLTAAAFTDTPSPTFTDTPVTRPPTVTPTPTLDPTELAATQNALALAQTATAIALASQASPTNTPAPPEALSIRENFATEVAFATAQGQFQQQVFSTLVAFGTQIAALPTDPQAEATVVQAIAATQAALDAELDAVFSAVDAVNVAIATLAGENASIATQLAAATSAIATTQAALATAQLGATQAAVETQTFLATQIAASADVGTPVSAATQAAFSTPPVFSTQAAMATQIILATRAALVELAEGGEVVVQLPTNPLEAVNQTATAIAGAFLTATAQAAGTAEVEPPVTPAVTPGFTPVATALPDTGLFDDIASNGGEGIGLLAVAVIGLIGVIFLSRRARTMNNKSAPPPPPNE
jgi:hypothetical protein